MITGMNRFCIYCGSSDRPDNPVINGACLKCRIERNQLITLNEENIYYEICRSCFSVKLGRKWFSTTSFESALETIIMRNFTKMIKPIEGVRDIHIERIEYLTKPSWHTMVKITLGGRVGEAVFKIPIVQSIYLKPSKCPRCVMIDSGDFNAVIQVRDVEQRFLEDVLNKVLGSSGRYMDSVIDIVETSNGIDIYFQDQNIARKVAREIARRMGLKIRENFEEVGIRDRGVLRTRLYISIRP